MIRPEVAESLARWRETLIGVALSGFGLYWIFTAYGILLYLGFGLLLIGVLLIWEGIRRARFPGQGGGTGMVEVDERQITYLSGQGGGAVSVDSLVRVEIVTTDRGPFENDLFWVFHDQAGHSLTIPGNAENAGLLFDALAALKGVNYDAVTRANGSVENDQFLVWQKPRQRLH